jgi:hypothetical protein
MDWIVWDKTTYGTLRVTLENKSLLYPKRPTNPMIPFQETVQVSRLAGSRPLR